MPSHVMPTYNRLAISFDRGEGVWLFDSKGERYLDALSGIAVTSLGHAHPAVQAAVAEQAGRLIHTSNIYGIQNQELLADRLTAASGMDAVFFSNSGAEANEAALKIARRYGNQQGISNPQVVVMQGSFHGRTLATLSATCNPKVHDGFQPLVEGFVRIDFDDINALQALVETNPNIVAVLVEPVQGEGGINIPTPDYLNNIRQLCDQAGWLMMLDEIQTGMGRTGKMFGFHHANIIPDVCTLAKALGNGVPIGACMTSGKASAVLSAGTHGSTFGGNPLACAAALAVMDTLESEQLVKNAATMGQYLLKQLQTQLADLPQVTEIRGLGMMIGIQLSTECSALVGAALGQLTLINVTAGNTIRLLPPLIFEQSHADQLVATLKTIIQHH